MKTPRTDVTAEGPWIDQWYTDKPLPPFDEKGDFKLTYSATCREPLIWAQCAKEQNLQVIRNFFVFTNRTFLRIIMALVMMVN